jgi:hypothetical protein
LLNQISNDLPLQKGTARDTMRSSAVFINRQYPGLCHFSQITTSNPRFLHNQHHPTHELHLPAPR